MKRIGTNHGNYNRIALGEALLHQVDFLFAAHSYSFVPKFCITLDFIILSVLRFFQVLPVRVLQEQQDQMAQLVAMGQQAVRAAAMAVLVLSVAEMQVLLGAMPGTAAAVLQPELEVLLTTVHKTTELQEL